MKDIFEKLKNNFLFAGIAPSDFDKLLACMDGQIKSYRRNEIVILSGNPVHSVGLVISGGVRILREDREGKENLLAEINEGEIFGEVFACAGVACSPITAAAREDSEILHIDYSKIIGMCPSVCPFHARMIENMLRLIAGKNLILNQKIEILSKRTTRERLCLFFEFQSQGTHSCIIPFGRKELAAYLCVERSAMSAELSRMQRDGLINCRKNKVELLY